MGVWCPKKLIYNTQLVENAPVRVVMKFRKYDNVTEASEILNWLPISVRLDLKNNCTKMEMIE